MRRHAIVLRLGDHDTEPIDVGSDIDVVTRLPFKTTSLPATGRVTHEKLFGRLKQLGLIPSETGMDLLVLAIAVFAGDTRISRESDSQDGWSREIDLHVPVSQVALWQPQRELLANTLRFLTGDLWRIQFRSRPTGVDQLAPITSKSIPYATDTVCLLSGGLDSFIGAIDLLESGVHPLLVGHHKSADVNTPQRSCAGSLKKAYASNAPELANLYLSIPKEPFAGVQDKHERGRSFLFLTLGCLVAASLRESTRLVVPENGLISLNAPLTSTRLGSLSTRTTHPYFLDSFQRLVRNVGLAVTIENPYQFKTKGDMVAGCLNQRVLKKSVSATMSCAHPTAGRFRGQEPMHCGRCVPCLIRRAAIAAAHSSDPTPYAVDVRRQVLDPTTAEGQDVRAFEIATHRLSSHPDLAKAAIHKSGPLPDKHHLDQYVAVYERGMGEVAHLLQRSRAART